VNITVIRPPLVGMRGDLFGSIPSIPVNVSYIAGALIDGGHEVDVIDCYGEQPLWRRRYNEKFVLRGISPDDVLARFNGETKVVGISVNEAVSHRISLDIMHVLRSSYPHLRFVFGGHHATAVADELVHKQGVDFVVLSEGEVTMLKLVNALDKGESFDSIDGLVWKDGRNEKHFYVENPDILNVYHTDVLPIENYWGLHYAHGPTSGRYMNVVTSRGCPYNCKFCPSPMMSQRKWRPRSPESVVQELEYYIDKYGIHDFHLNDENSTAGSDRTRQICELILEKKLDITFCMPSGIKVETVDEALLDLLKKAGCTFFTLSAESGSQRLLKLMDKPVDLEHLMKITRHACKIGIRTSCFFMIGYPGETNADWVLTRKYVARLTRAGIDEIVCPLMIPVPGAEANEDFEQGSYDDYGELTFTPKWRSDYKTLEKKRLLLYLMFYLRKAFWHPWRTFLIIPHVLFWKHTTKGEMTINRVLDNFRRVKRQLPWNSPAQNDSSLPSCDSAPQ
jgi:anaerobic magnesium-protoporphyrin IX monomethyl ester cyclase